MKKYLFIANPSSGAGRSKKTIEKIDQIMKDSGKSYDIVSTKESYFAEEIINKHIDDYTDFIAVGGDGTVTDVGRALVQKKKGTLGIIPAGTGNDFSLALKIPKDIKEALDLILREDRQVKEVDIPSINGKAYLNITSIGFDADVVKLTNSIKKIIKSEVAYVISVILSLLRFRKSEIELIIDGKSHYINSFLLAVGKGKYYGGGMPIMPNAELENGYLEVCSVKDASNLTILRLFPSIFKASHTKHIKYVTMYKAKEVIAKLDKDMILNIDGELIEANKERTLSFRIEDYKLPVVSNL